MKTFKINSPYWVVTCEVCGKMMVAGDWKEHIDSGVCSPTPCKDFKSTSMPLEDED